MARRSRNRSTSRRSETKASSIGGTKPALNRDWLWAAALMLAVFAAYVPVWWAGYIWDDDVVVTNNPVVIGPKGLWEIWTSRDADICPLTMTTFHFEHALWGNAPLFYHLVNVLFHGGSAVLLWHVLRKLRVPGAWLGAALWALHPVQVESVAWITELKNCQSGFLFLCSILFFLRALASSTPRAYVLSLLCAAGAMSSKSSTVILPLVLILC